MTDLNDMHPLIVHFPIVLLIIHAVAALLWVIRKKDLFLTLSLIFILAGVITGVTAVLTGNLSAQETIKIMEGREKSETDKQIKAVIEEHEDAATLLLWFYSVLGAAYLITWIKKVLRKDDSAITGLRMWLLALLSAAGILLLVYTGWHGGELVYKYGVGTGLFK